MRVTNYKLLADAIRDAQESWEAFHDEVPDEMVCITGPKLPDWITTSLPWITPSFPPSSELMYDTHGKQRTIFLFPETGKSINEQAAFVSSIVKTYPNAVVITYAPFIISDFKQQNVLVFGKDNVITRPEFQTFGASVNQITMCLLERHHTQGDYSIARFEEYRNQIKTCPKKNLDALVHEIYKALGDSVERVLLIKTLIDKGRK